MAEAAAHFQKVSKAEAEYEHPADGPDHCQDCKFFEVRGPNQCLRVKGLIMPRGWCRFFKSK